MVRRSRPRETWTEIRRHPPAKTCSALCHRACASLTPRHTSLGIGAQSFAAKEVHVGAAQTRGPRPFSLKGSGTRDSANFGRVQEPRGKKSLICCCFRLTIRTLYVALNTVRSLVFVDGFDFCSFDCLFRVIYSHRSCRRCRSRTDKTRGSGRAARSADLADTPGKRQPNRSI